MDYQENDVRSFWNGWIEAIRKYPGRTLAILVATILLGSILVIAVAFLSSVGSRLAETKLEMSSLTNQLAELRIDVRQAVTMKQEVSQTVNVITKVEKEIANIKEAIKQLYERIRTDVFRSSETEKRCSFKKLGGGVVVALRLSGCPIRESINGIWGNRLLYPTSIKAYDNVLLTVFAGDDLMTNEVFSITYTLDPEKEHLFKNMEVRDGNLYLDNEMVDESLLP